MKTKLSVHFDNHPYVRSHMVEPRGFGSWAFRVSDEVTFTPAPMTLREAKTWMTKRLRDDARYHHWGVVYVDVLP